MRINWRLSWPRPGEMERGFVELCAWLLGAVVVPLLIGEAVWWWA